MIFVRIFVLTETKTMIMKKNTFKPSDFKYEPVRQDKLPLWMNTVQSYRTSKTTTGELVCISLIVIAIAVAWSVLGN